MNEFLSKYPVIRLLLQRFRNHNIEYTAVAVFQTSFSVLFPVIEGYVVNMEQSVDRERNRVDLLVQRADVNYSTLYPVLIGEGKGGGKTAREVETQVRSRALEAIEAHGMERIFAATWLGETFRFWQISAADKTLEPIDNRGARNQKSAYIMLDSPEGGCIETLCTHIKDNLPSPVVSNQNIPADLDYPMNQPSASSAYYRQEYMHSAANPPAADASAYYGRDYMHSAANPPAADASAYYRQDYMHSAANPPAADVPSSNPPAADVRYSLGDDDQWEGDEVEDDEAGPSNRRRKEPKHVKVVIEKRENNPGYKFLWKGREKVKTEREDWDRNGNILIWKKKKHKCVVWGEKP